MACNYERLLKKKYKNNNNNNCSPETTERVSAIWSTAERRYVWWVNLMLMVIAELKHQPLHLTSGWRLVWVIKTTRILLIWRACVSTMNNLNVLPKILVFIFYIFFLFSLYNIYIYFYPRISSLIYLHYDIDKVWIDIKCSILQLYLYIYLILKWIVIYFIFIYLTYIIIVCI